VTFTGWAEWGQPDVITRVVNPVTRTIITLKPVIEINNERAYSDFQHWVLTYCKECWDQVPRINPEEIDASNWRDGLPTAI
jgi:hypothetical protein